MTPDFGLETGAARFVTCSDCDGYGAHVIGRGRWPDGSENNEERPCPTCSGTGTAETVVAPITLDDLDELLAEPGP